MIIKKKVLAYITNGTKLLVFSEPEFPEIGLQVPGGTVEPDEKLEIAMLREIEEETGLTDFKIVEYLGSNQRNMSDYGKNEIHERHFYHAVTNERTDETWEHIEKFSSEIDQEIIFSFKWVDLKTEIPELLSQGFYLQKLLEKIII